MSLRYAAKKSDVLPGGVAFPSRGTASPGFYFNLAWRWRLVIVACVGLYFLARYVVDDASRGVGGTGAGNIFAQCVFKSYAHVEDYSKTGERYTSVTDVLTLHGKRPEGATVLSTDFATDKGSRHNFSLYYDVMLEPYVARTVNVLEIGVKKGGSIKMWRELFSAESRIYGADVDPAIATFPRDAGVKTLVVDSTVAGLPAKSFAGTQFDIVIDDGSHNTAHQLRTFTNLWPLMRPTGVYIVEDLLGGWEYPSFNEDAAFKADMNARAKRGELRWLKYADTSGEALLVVVGPESLAVLPTVGLLDASENHAAFPTRRV